nr:chaperone protein dnaj [Quercus suber]
MASATPFDPFGALGVSRDASPALIKARYRELARRYHPNRQQGSDDDKRILVEYFQQIHHAWQLLRTPDNRRRYVELLQLAESQEAILRSMADLLEESNEHTHHEPHSHDGHISSDGD